MNTYLHTLEHLSYIIECVVIDSMGEAKYELDNLISKIETEYLYSSPDLSQVLPLLKEAREEYQVGNIAKGSGILSSTNRSVWKIVLGLIKDDVMLNKTEEIMGRNTSWLSHLNKASRIGFVASVIWVLIFLAKGISEASRWRIFNFEQFFVIFGLVGLAPVILYWGIRWIRSAK